MTTRRTLFVLLFPLLTLGYAPQALAQDKSEDQPKPFNELTQEEQKAMLETMAALAQPGPEHALLKALEGTWTHTTKVWHEPGGEPEVQAGEGTNRMILGGRFLEMTSTGRMWGQPKKSLTLLGFDRRKGQFSATAFDTFGTYSVSAMGPYDKAARKTVMSGTDDDPTTGFVQRYDFVLTWVDADTYRFAIWFKDQSHGNSEPFKLVEVTSTRKE